MKSIEAHKYSTENTLGKRPIGGDLIKVCRIMNGLEEVEQELGFTLPHNAIQGDSQHHDKIKTHKRKYLCLSTQLAHRTLCHKT